ncbi:FapA family protein [Halanaerobium sp.]|uniref:FapA family protein n=1 Tax=Halanaerobium sp. TaxID=1895664 RepID=UPI0025C6F0C3|nr:FapA family protein [Halanaerobium sp.]
MKNKDGVAYLRDGKLYISDPEGLGRYPRISAGKDVELYLEDNKIKDEIVVSESSLKDIVLDLNNTIKKKDLNLKFDNKGLKAYLEISTSPAKKLSLKNIQPSNIIKVKSEVVDEIYPEVNEKEIRSLLQEKSVSYGIKEEVIKDIVSSREYNDSYLVAEGKQAESGKDAEIITTEKYKERKNKIFNEINSVEKGDTICYKKSLKKGNPGINVFGEEIKPAAVKDIELRAGENVRLIKNKAVAEKGGQPKIVKKNNTALVKVVEQYVINNDIDKNTGDINYDGDLLVKGNVQDYFNVSVGQDLKVSGNVANAEVLTRGSLFVNKNIIGSKVKVGNYLDDDLLNFLEKTERLIEDISKSIDEILGEADKRKMGSSVKLGRILKLLIEDKFDELPDLIGNLRDKIDDNYKLKKTLNKLAPFMNKLHKLENLNNYDLFNELLNNIKELLKSRNNNKELNIYAGYIQNSSLLIGGSLVINKKGCYNSKIEASNSIIVKNNSGFLRGGWYKAENIIYCSQAGNNLGKTYFDISNQIYIKKAIGTLVISSPKDKKIIDPGVSSVNLIVNKYGKLEQFSVRPDIKRFLISEFNH